MYGLDIQFIHSFLIPSCQMTQLFIDFMEKLSDRQTKINNIRPLGSIRWENQVDCI